MSRVIGSLPKRNTPAARRIAMEANIAYIEGMMVKSDPDLSRALENVLCGLLRSMAELWTEVNAIKAHVGMKDVLETDALAEEDDTSSDAYNKALEAYAADIHNLLADLKKLVDGVSAKEAKDSPSEEPKVKTDTKIKGGTT